MGWARISAGLLLALLMLVAVLLALSQVGGGRVLMLLLAVACGMGLQVLWRGRVTGTGAGLTATMMQIAANVRARSAASLACKGQIAADPSRPNPQQPDVKGLRAQTPPGGLGSGSGGT